MGEFDPRSEEITPAMIEAGHQVLYEFGSDWADGRPPEFLAEFLSALYVRMSQARSGILPGPKSR